MNSGDDLIAFREHRGADARPRSRRAVLCAIALLFSAPLRALDPRLLIGEYLHTTWTQEEGSALPPIQAAAQTADGYLWLGTADGLIRFDGMRFVKWSPLSGPALPSADIRCLRPASAGGLWAGTRNGLCRVDRGRVVHYPATEKLPCSFVSSLIEDRAGRLWIIKPCPQSDVLAMLSPDGSVQTFGVADGLPSQALKSLLEDRQGRLWVGTSNGLYLCAPSSRPACTPSVPMSVVSMLDRAGGGLLALDDRRKQLLQVIDGRTEALGEPISDASFRPGAMIRDHDGNLWIGTVGQGLLRVRDHTVDRFTRKDGLSSNSITGLVEDHEGDLWVATARGVDRFRDPKVRVLSTLDGLTSDNVSAVFGARDGAVWIGTIGGGLNRFAGRRVSPYSVAQGLPNPTVLSLFEDDAGRMWSGTSAGLAVEAGGRFAEVRTSEGERLREVFNIGCSPSSGVWLTDRNRVFRVRGRVAEPVSLPDLAGRDLYRLLVARDGAVWLGHFRGGVSVVNGDSARHYGPADGLAAGAVRALYQDRQGTIWAGADGGLSRFDGSRWTTWTTLPEGGVHGIVEGPQGGLWLLGSSGVLRFSQAPPYIVYGPSEGLRLLRSSSANPRIARAGDGRLWICTQDGIAIIDPSRVSPNAVPPPVAIEQVAADGRSLDPVAGRIAYRGRELQIAYTGLSLMVPEGVRFRYRLAGVDRGWTDAGTRRSVTYVNLPPGTHRFQVIASNNDGLWNNIGAELSVEVIPYIYQTIWFYLACVTAALVTAWLVHWLKMRRVVERFRLIGAERARFSRELHDSLLQGFAGVVYLLEAAARQFEANPEASRQRLDRALEQADRSLSEARQMIVNMRIPALDNATLAEAMEATLGQAASGMPIDFQFSVEGRPRQAPYDVEANLFLIAREAVTNALAHADATRISVSLGYTQRGIRLCIEDDGAGFDPKAAMTKAGHWGLKNMQDRARLIKGGFSIDTAPGRGARIEVTVAM